MGVLKLCVLGAGVIGCTTATLLQDTFPNSQVYILADKFYRETLSDGAAGIFRPGTSFRVVNDSVTSQVIRDSYHYYSDVTTKAVAKHSGVSEVSGYIFSNTSQSLVENYLIDKVVPVYRRANNDELKDWKYGAFFSTLLTECRYFLPWTLDRFQQNGGEVRKGKIVTLRDEVLDEFEVVVNCLGMGAQQVCKDYQLVPIRGQVFKVKASWVKNFYYADYDTYVIPGLDTVTLGGCRNYDSYDTSLSRHDSASIWERCTTLVPQLKLSQVEREWVGLRPHRHEVRIEKELLQSESGKTHKVVHNYGHGGYGVTTAPGCGKYAVQLVVEMLHSRSKL